MGFTAALLLAGGFSCGLLSHLLLPLVSLLVNYGVVGTVGFFLLLACSDKMLGLFYASAFYLGIVVSGYPRKQ